jgi:hypothetical protein
MAVIEKIVAAVTPMESQKDRADVRAKARKIAGSGNWFSLILDHHVELEDAFAKAKMAPDATAGLAALKHLGIILTGHAGAEETVIYPALADAGEKSHSEMGYDEQVTVKMDMAELEKLAPQSKPYLEKLEAIREAVAHHMYEEEGTWYPELHRKAPAADQAKITKRYKEEYDRYVGGDA